MSDVVEALLTLVSFAVSAAIVYGVVLLARVLRELEAQGRTLAGLAERSAKRADAPAAESPAADGAGRLEALERLALEIGEGQRRLDARLVELVDRAQAAPSVVQTPVASGALEDDGTALLERATNRLVSQGYEQVEIVTPRDQVTPDAELVVEARRNGMVHKGRVKLLRGAVADVDLRPAHGLFP